MSRSHLPPEGVDTGLRRAGHGGLARAETEADHVLVKRVSVGLAATGPPGPGDGQRELPPGG